jgi:hypothetical protein
MDRPSSRTSFHLEPPRKSIELLDPGAREIGSPITHDLQLNADHLIVESSEDEYFSDASEGRRKSRPVSPIPRTRVEMVDDIPSHGQIPGSSAYQKRIQDAVPDEVEIVPEGRLSKRSSMASLEPPRSPGGTIIPRTVVEKVDPSSPSYGDVPGTPAYEKRLADAPPDIVLKVPEPGQSRTSLDYDRPAFDLSNIPIPQTIITRIDSLPAESEADGTATPRKRLRPAEPADVGIEEDIG